MRFSCYGICRISLPAEAWQIQNGVREKQIPFIVKYPRGLESTFEKNSGKKNAPACRSGHFHKNKEDYFFTTLIVFSYPLPLTVTK
jgi:hypothetical protein